jgi:hypothetical protein
VPAKSKNPPGFLRNIRRKKYRGSSGWQGHAWWIRRWEGPDNPACVNFAKEQMQLRKTKYRPGKYENTPQRGILKKTLSIDETHQKNRKKYSK